MKLPVRDPAALPPLQQQWVDALLGGTIPGEPRATCQTCPQIEERDGHRPFDPRTKCCTYMPALYNFLAGRILDEKDASAVPGRDTVEARIDKGDAVTPLGLLATSEYVEAYAKDQTFGHAYQLRCPHYLADQGGLCGVWKHREGTCSTWFCKHVRGSVAFDFWRRGMTPLFRAAERALAGWCAKELGADEHEWGRFAGQPRELYREAARLVAPLGWRQVVEIGGDEVATLAGETQTYFIELQKEAAVPLRPRVQPYDLQSSDERSATLTTYTPFDPVEVPARLLAELHRFNGRPRAEVLRELQKLGAAPDEELLVKLADWRVIAEDTAPALQPRD